jgi:hypothetical protein
LQVMIGAIGLGLSAASAIFQGVKGLQQTREAKEMQKNLGPRVNYQIPEEARKALALYENMAVSRTMPGQQLMQNMIDLEQSKALGQMSRVGNAQDAAGIIQGLGQKGMEQQQEMGLASAQNYIQRQKDLANARGVMAGYEEKVTTDQQMDWYERAAAAREMREAGLQNTMGAVQGLGQMGMMAAMGGFGGGEQMASPSDYSFTDPSSMSTKVGYKIFKNAPRFAGSTSAAAASPSMPRASQGVFDPTFSNKIGKNPGMWDEYQPFVPKLGFYNGTDMSGWRSSMFNNIH